MASPSVKYLKYTKEKTLVVAGTSYTQVPAPHSLDENYLRMRRDHKDKMCLPPG